MIDSGRAILVASMGKRKMIQCNRERLQRLLEESLPAVVEDQVAEHLANCPDCQVELESLAAGKGWWAEATQRLSGIKSAGMGGGMTGVFDIGLSERELDDDALSPASDFAVDFLDPSDDSSMLGRLGEYEILSVIGRGGMGLVLKGFQKELNRYVAVKILAPHLATSGAARRRFSREAQATAAIVHPHVMAIHSVHANARLPYLVMPFVACESLQQRIDRQGPLEVQDVLRIGMQAAQGLAAAHAQGLVHRDVKPANILLETTVDRVMLTDFGLARAVDDASLTRTGVIAGTPQYMSPEQASGDAIDHRSDLFSLGSVLYAMCAGRPPFRAETTFGVLRRIRESEPRSIREINAHAPLWLERIIGVLLSKQAEDRIWSAQQIAGLLQQCLAHSQQPTVNALPKELERAAASIDKVGAKGPVHRVWIAAAAGIVVAIGLSIKFANQPIGNAPKQAEAVSAAGLETYEPPSGWNDMELELGQAQVALESLEESSEADLKVLGESSQQPADALEPAN